MNNKRLQIILETAENLMEYLVDDRRIEQWRKERESGLVGAGSSVSGYDSTRRPGGLFGAGSSVSGYDSGSDAPTPQLPSPLYPRLPSPRNPWPKRPPDTDPPSYYPDRPLPPPGRISPFKPPFPRKPGIGIEPKWPYVPRPGFDPKRPLPLPGDIGPYKPFSKMPSTPKRPRPFGADDFPGIYQPPPKPHIVYAARDRYLN
jgi:hypothetical protein